MYVCGGRVCLVRDVPLLTTLLLLLLLLLSSH